MELKEATGRVGDLRRVGRVIYCNLDDIDAMRILISAAEKAEEYREKAEKWDAIEWASRYEESQCEDCPMSIHTHKSAEVYCQGACEVLKGNKMRPILSAYRKAQEGK